MLDVCPHCGKSLRLSGNQAGQYSLYLISYGRNYVNEDFKRHPLMTGEFFTQASAILDLKGEAVQHVNCMGYSKCRGTIYKGKQKIHEFWVNRGDKAVSL
jgi:ssDNA-binding Zn-finger/Zn-ribbon topoisomerase 1